MSEKPRAYIDPSVRLFDRSNRVKLILAAVTGVLIAVTYVLFHKDFPSDLIQLLPLYVSLFVMLLQTNASRYAFLLGGINSIFYINSFVTVLNMLAYIEYLPLQAVTMALNVYMYTSMALEDAARTPYAVYYVYSAVCLGFTFVRVWGLYRQQQAERKQ